MNKEVEEQINRWGKFYNKLINKLDDLKITINNKDHFKGIIFDLISDYEQEVINDPLIKNEIHKKVDLEYLKKDIIDHLEYTKRTFLGLDIDEWKNIKYSDVEYILDDIADKRDTWRMEEMDIDYILTEYENEVQYRGLKIDDIKNELKEYIKDTNNKSSNNDKVKDIIRS